MKQLDPSDFDLSGKSSPLEGHCNSCRTNATTTTMARLDEKTARRLGNCYHAIKDHIVVTNSEGETVEVPKPLSHVAIVRAAYQIVYKYFAGAVPPSRLCASRLVSLVMPCVSASPRRQLSCISARLSCPGLDPPMLPGLKRTRREQQNAANGRKKKRKRKKKKKKGAMAAAGADAHA